VADTVLIYGSGWSLTKISEPEWERLRQYDSIGFNWFIWQTWIRPTYMLVGGIRWDKHEKKLGKNKQQAYQNYGVQARTPRYGDTVFLATDWQSELSGGLPNEHRVVRTEEWETEDLGKIHWSQETSNTHSALGWAIKKGYRRAVLLGIDLYDYRYFYLGKNQLRRVGGRKGKFKKPNLNDVHVGAKKILGFFYDHPEVFDQIEIVSYNRYSLLLQVPQIKCV